jgi:protein SCO1/2
MRRFASSVVFAAAVLAAGGASADAPPPAELEQALRNSQAAIGRTVGDWAFTDHRGRPLSAADLRGKPWVASFIYTGCFQVCPATTQFLKSAVRSARDALGPGRFRVVSIGFNQPFDTPEALAAFARQQGVSLDDWVFVAPREADVEALLAQFGLTVKATPSGFDHLLQVSIVDADNRIHRQVYGDAFELPMFIGPLKELLGGQASQQVSLENIWLKVKLYCTVYDPTAGRYKFNYSLFVELFAGITFLGALIAFMVREGRRQGWFGGAATPPRA